MKPDLLIYQDYVHNNGLLHRALAPFGEVGFCDAADVLNGILEQSPRLLVMPGGADLYYCEKLNGAGNDAIRRYVENGGRYLGICAGAYYACAALSWAAGTKQEISGPRELGFYSGTATGPALPLMQGMDQSWLGVAELAVEDGRSVSACYEAGPVFTEPKNGNSTIIARYAALPGQPPAIISCAVGKGKVVLSGPHIERASPQAEQSLYENQNPHYDYERGIYNALRSHAAEQLALWDHVINGLLAGAEGLRNAA